MKKYAKKILSKRKLREVGLFDERRVQQIIKMQTDEAGGRYGIWLWMILSFEMWRKRVVENEPL